MPRRSTELCPSAAPLEGVPGSVQASIARHLSVENETGAIERYCAKEENVLSTLLEMDFDALLVLEVLAEAGGEIRESTLRAELMGRHRWGEAASDLALERFHERVWFALWGGNSDPFRILIRPAAEIVARLVRGISLPDPPPAKAQGTLRRSSLGAVQRQTIALAAATAHDDLRLTASGSPHQASVKKLAKRIGLASSEAENLYRRASTLGLLRTRGRMLTPDVERLTAYAHRPSPHAVDDWIDERWVSHAAIERAMFRTSFAAARGYPGFGMALLDSLDLETIEHEGQRFVRRGRATRTGDGHVTPSFDVMLGPSADLETVAAVGLFAELVRFDRVISYRITRESVANAAALGVGAESILATLALVGPHGVPENVAATIHDFAGAARTGELVLGWHLVLPPGTKLPLLTPELATPVGDRAYTLAPGLRFADLEEALKKARVALRPGLGVSEAARAIGTRTTLGDLPEKLHEASDRNEPPLPLVPGGHPELRRRVREKWTRPRPARVPAPPAKKQVASTPEPAPGFQPSSGPFAQMLAFAREEGFADEDVAALAALASLEVGALRELGDFAARTKGPGAGLTVDPVGLMSFCVLEPRWKKKLMRRATDVDDLLELACGECKPSHLSLQGRKLRRLLRDEEFHALLDELIYLVREAQELEPSRDAGTIGAPPAASSRATKAEPAARADRSADATPQSEEIDPDPAPAWTAIPKLEPSELAAFLLEHVETDAVIAVALNETHDPRVRVVKAATLQRRGDELALFAVDVVSDEARVIHVRDVVGATVVAVI